jgi:glycosyltransferase involved in cell wall biosynthesis
MTHRTDHQTEDVNGCPIAWVVPGPLRQLTGGYLYDARIVDGLRMRGWSVGVVDVRSARWPVDPAAGGRILSALGRQRWGAVVVDELAHPALAAALVGGRLRRALDGAPLVVLVHHLRCSEGATGWRQAAARLVEECVLRSADLVICNSENTALTTGLMTCRSTRIEVVRPGWDTHQPLARQLSDGLLSSGLGRRAVDGASSLRLLLVGHWTPRKGILDALAAVARLGPGVTLDLVGDQNRDPRYAARVWATLQKSTLADRVRVHGRVSADRLAALYTSADALILPSSHEGYGMVLAEALVAGLPVVATRVGAVPEVVRDGLEAVLVPPGDVGALARAIDGLAADPAKRERRARFARERALTLPSWSDSIAAFDGHLRAALVRTSTGA